MIIGIEAQRIFRKNKHGMDYVVLQEIRELQKIDKENEYYVFVKPNEDRSGSNGHCQGQPSNMALNSCTAPATRPQSGATFHWC